MSTGIPNVRNGKWVYRDADVHRCIKPTYEESPRVMVGDRWQCNACGNIWRVSKIVDDQRDGTWLVWEEYESYKSGPFAPGTK